MFSKMVRNMVAAVFVIHYFRGSLECTGIFAFQAEKIKIVYVGINLDLIFVPKEGFFFLAPSLFTFSHLFTQILKSLSTN